MSAARLSLDGFRRSPDKQIASFRRELSYWTAARNRQRASMPAVRRPSQASRTYGEAIVREWWAVWLWALGACLLAVPAAAESVAAAPVNGSTFQIQMLDPAAAASSSEQVI